MPAFEAGTVAKVPFPYTNRDTTQHRPALVISNGAIGSGMFLWVLMITSESNRAWPGDVPLGDGYAAAGLPAPSRIRTLKIATIEANVAEPMGSVAPNTLRSVQTELRTILGLAP